MRSITSTIVAVCIVSTFCSGQSIELIDVVSVSPEGYTSPILNADEKGGTIDFEIEKNDKTCNYQFEWSFTEDVVSLENGDRINIDLNYNKQEHNCGQKRVYGLITGSNKVKQVPNFDYEVNNNIKYVKGTGNAYSWFDGFRSQTYVLKVDIDQPSTVTTFSIQAGLHRVVYVYEYDPNAKVNDGEELSKARILPKGHLQDTEK